MAKISYELKNDEINVSMEGNGNELFKGVCRLAVNLKNELDLKEDEFEKMLLKGIKMAEMESRLDDTDDALDAIDKLLGMLKDLLDD